MHFVELLAARLPVLVFAAIAVLTSAVIDGARCG